MRNRLYAFVAFYAAYLQAAGKRFWAKVKKTETCWLWESAFFDNGYGQYTFYQGKVFKAHRMAWLLTYGSVPDYKKTGLVLMHTCDNKRCVNPSHLKAVTSRENVHDAIAKDRSPTHRKGQRHFRSVFTDKQVDDLKELYKTTTARELSRLTGVNINTIWSLVNS
jgi:hypothetical protein